MSGATTEVSFRPPPTPSRSTKGPASRPPPDRLVGHDGSSTKEWLVLILAAAVGVMGYQAAARRDAYQPASMTMVVVWDDGAVTHGEVPADRCALVSEIAVRGQLNEDPSGRLALAATCAPTATIRAAFSKLHSGGP